MQQITRFILIAMLTAAIMTGGVWATENGSVTTEPIPTAPPAPEAMSAPAVKPSLAEYKRADTNFYPKGDIVKSHPSATIVLIGGYSQKDGSYFFQPKKKAPKELYVETLNDWVEPITPPDMPASLGVPPDEMQIREPQGDVQVAMPAAPASFAQATDGMTIPNGAVLKTGTNGTAAVLFGGVDSARLMPDSEAAVQQTVTAQSRSAEVDLTTGGVFSKVGTQEGVQGEYEVHTPFGNAVAHGTDFVTIISGSRTDVWVAQGTVQLEHPDTKIGDAVASDGTGPLKVMRFPGISDPRQSVLADIETMTEILNFIPLANQKIKGLRDKIAAGTTLTDNEQAYLKRIKQVPCLIKLALVPPPAPPPVLAIAPLAPAPSMSLAPVPAPAPAPPAKPKLVTVYVHADGKIKYLGALIDLPTFQAKLKDLAQATPDRSLVIKAAKTVPYDKVKAVMDSCHDANVKYVTSVVPPPAPSPQPEVPTASPATPSETTPAVVATPAVPAPPAPEAATATTPAVTSTPPATASSAPIRAVVRVDGKVNFKGATYELPGFKSKLVAIIKANPDQAIVVKAGKTVPFEKLKAVLDACDEAQVKYLSVISAAPTPPAPAGPSTSNLPAPGLLMHPSMEPITSTTTPAPSTPTPNTDNPPTTNAPPPSGP
jgi:biopolymer transport protein ExbD